MSKAPDFLTSMDDTPLKFGKYRGMTPKEVADEDLGYVVWLHEKVPNTVSADLYDSCLECMSEAYDNYTELDFDTDRD